MPCTLLNPGGGSPLDTPLLLFPPDPLLTTHVAIGGEQKGLPYGVGGQNDGDNTGDSIFGLGGSISGGNGPGGAVSRLP